MRRIFLKSFAAALTVSAFPAAAAAAADTGPVNVVYHLSEGIDQATRAMGNIRNHLRAAPDTRIVVVGLGEGIRFMLKGAAERSGRPFDAAIAALAAQGVEFRVCGNTLAAHDVPRTDLVPQATIVQAGVAEIARLQAREGFAYLRP